MVDFSKVAAAVLAAGQSRRFGKNDKLTALLKGKMLGLHVAESLAPFPFAEKTVITSAIDHPCANSWRALGFEVVVNEKAKDGLGTSVALAAQMAQTTKAEALLICLADMPFIGGTLIRNLVDRFPDTDPDAILASSDGSRTSPPVLFGVNHLDSLADLDGDQGARAFLASADSIVVAPERLKDIDRARDI